MSLINDALKQIKQARNDRPSSGPLPLSPVESEQCKGLGWLVPGIIVFLLVAAAVFAGISLFKSTPLVASVAPSKSHTAPDDPAATRQVQAAAVIPPATNQIGKSPVTAASTNSTPSDTNAVVVSKPPELKLQGILFAATRPCAIVNGRTLVSGDHIDGFRVARISKDSITLQKETQTRVLSLNPQ